MHFDAEFFVAAGFLLFVCLLFYVGVHKTILGGLDARSQRIADELGEARRLRGSPDRPDRKEQQSHDAIHWKIPGEDRQ